MSRAAGYWAIGVSKFSINVLANWAAIAASDSGVGLTRLSFFLFIPGYLPPVRLPEADNAGMGTSWRPDHVVEPVPDRHVGRVTELTVPVIPAVECSLQAIRA